MSNLEHISVNEQLLLKLLKDNPNYINNIEDNIFLSNTARNIFDTYRELKKENKLLTNEHIVRKGNVYCSDITLDVMNKLDIKPYDLNDFEDYINKLRQDYARRQLAIDYYPKITKEISKPTFDIDVWEGLSNEIKKAVQIVKGKNQKVLTTQDMTELHRQEMYKRIKNPIGYTTGCHHLDSVFTTGFVPGETTLIFARSSQGKSLVTTNLQNKLINQYIPVLKIATEMSGISEMDRFLCMRTGLTYDEIKHIKQTDDDNIEGEYQLSVLEKEYEELAKHNHFHMVTDADLSLDNVEKIITEIQEKYDYEYMIVILDLFTQLKDFDGSNKASKSEDAVNKQNAIAKRCNVHFLNLVQSKRGDNINIKTVEDIKRYRPNADEIKNAGAFEERSRNIISVFQPMFYAKRYLSNDPILESLENIIELQVWKQSNGDIGGRASYLFEPDTFTLTPYPNANFFTNYMQEYEELKEDVNDKTRENKENKK